MQPLSRPKIIMTNTYKKVKTSASVAIIDTFWHVVFHLQSYWNKSTSLLNDFIWRRFKGCLDVWREAPPAWSPAPVWTLSSVWTCVPDVSWCSLQVRWKCEICAETKTRAVKRDEPEWEVRAGWTGLTERDRVCVWAADWLNLNEACCGG